MSNVTPLNVKPDRLANQLAMHESMKDELRQVLEKYRGLDLLPMFINDAFAQVGSEAAMGPLAMILDGDEPA
ncbi:MAG: hypothetical protein U1D65_06355 [Pseudomonas sp.]|nr:hypothetical protein [Pseudomonas sp.]MDZ4191611.1 hypothetical protein [Pseudomonas sp.]